MEFLEEQLKLDEILQSYRKREENQELDDNFIDSLDFEQFLKLIINTKLDTY